MPLARQWQAVRTQPRAILASIAAGSAFAALSGVALAWGLGGGAALAAARPMRMAMSISAAPQPVAPNSRAVASAAGMSRSRPAIVAVAQVVPAAQTAAPSTLAGAWAA